MFEHIKNIPLKFRFQSKFLLILTYLSLLVMVIIFIKEFPDVMKIWNSGLAGFFDVENNTAINNFEDLLRNSYLIKQRLFYLIGAVASSIFFFACYRLHKLIFAGHNAWAESTVFSLCFVILISVLAYFTTFFVHNDDMDIIIDNKKDLDIFLADRRKVSVTNKEMPPVFIPTGVFMQSIEFTSSYNCIVTFMIWQRYNVRDTADYSIGFELPEAQEADVEEAYRKYNADSTVLTVGWNVKATIREIFNFRLYPFDHQNLWVRFWHKDFDKNVILVPDIKSYPQYNPFKKVGLEEDMVLPGWSVKGSYFGYRKNSYSTNFGIDSYIGAENFPELYFNVFVQRDFMSVFFSDLTPVLMVVVLLFITIYVSHDETTETDFFKFSVMDVAGIVGTLIFVVILAQIDLRSNLSTDTVLYIEYYYFIIYFLLFLVMVNYILFQKKGLDWHLIEYRDNYIPKVLFFPILTFSIFMVTIILFF
ncbi:MAG: hypothetical protein EAZ57_02830 [Cytophagales bacterium]|nr:MAG: hypothetical protein EAZ67_03295 [Cytophagales bacterium]TAF61695.1 MAG: hypothetical protein EAZ57_02830 [Cytophagales bacterium]